MPPAPPCTSNVSPERRPATIITLDQTVAGDLGQGGGGDQVDAVGLGHHLPRRDGDPGRVATAGEQGADLLADLEPGDAGLPSAATVPLHSRPRMSEAPGGGG